MNGSFEEATSVVSINPTDRERYIIDAGHKEIRYWKNCARNLLFCGIILIICLFLNNSIQNQEKEMAYQMSSIVTLQEEILLLKYQLLPSHVGLEELRSEWISNPCYDTILPYSKGLDQVLNYLEEYGIEQMPGEESIPKENEPQFI